MSTPQIYECTGCGWLGTSEEKIDKPDEAGFGTLKHCPECDGFEFYLFNEPQQATDNTAQLPDNSPES